MCVSLSLFPFLSLSLSLSLFGFYFSSDEDYPAESGPRGSTFDTRMGKETDVVHCVQGTLFFFLRETLKVAGEGGNERFCHSGKDGAAKRSKKKERERERKGRRKKRERGQVGGKDNWK